MPGELLYSLQDCIDFSFCFAAVTIVIHNYMAAFSYFTKRAGIYFYSLMIGNLGVVCHNFGFLLYWFFPKAFSVPSFIFLTIIVQFGWVMMVFCCSLAVYTRFNLMRPDWRVTRVAQGILAVSACIHATVITSVITASFPGYASAIIVCQFLEVYQITWFCIQETFFGLTYVYYVWQFTKMAERGKGEKSNVHRAAIKHSLVAAFLILLLDVVVLCLAFANLYETQVEVKGFIYAIKYRAEFYILNQLKSTFAPQSNSSNRPSVGNQSNANGLRSTPVGISTPTNGQSAKKINEEDMD